MAKTYDEITPDIERWLSAQQMFFVATAPLGRDGLVNCSPKGMDSFRVLGPREVAYLDLTGSGIETTAHLQENGRIVFMFCAFAGPPRIMRLHGTGDVAPAGSETFAALKARFPEYPGARAIIRATVTRISDSCGYAVPRFDFIEPRDALLRWAEKRGDEGLLSYRRENNRYSLDGLPGLEAPD
jgi:hypothetical protein